MKTPRWLVASVVGVVASTAVLAVSWVGVCTFVTGPKIFQAVVAGKIQQEPKVCDNVEDRAIQILTGLLATLLALMSNPPTDPKP